MSGKLVEYRAVELSWLLGFQQQIVASDIAPNKQLALATEPFGDLSEGGFTLAAGETVCVVDGTLKDKTVVCSKAHGEVRKGEVPSSALRIKERSEWTTEDVCEFIIKEACAESGSCYASLLPTKVLSKKEFQGTFVLHARGCKFSELVECLVRYYEIREPTEGSEVSPYQYVWLDVLHVNQTKDTPVEAEPTFETETETEVTKILHAAVAKFDQVALFMDTWDNPMPLKRAWCAWELLGVSKAKRELCIMLPESEEYRYIGVLKSDYKVVTASIAKIGVEDGKCYNAIDQERIFSAIEGETFVGKLNELVKSQLRKWVLATALAEIELEEKNPSQEVAELALLIDRLGNLYRDQGMYDTCRELVQKGLKLREQLCTDRETDPAIAESLHSMAELYRFEGEFDLGLPLAREALAIRKKIYGHDHIDVAQSVNNVALLLRTGTYDGAAEATKLYEEALAIRRKILDPNHPLIAQSLHNVAGVHKDKGHTEIAKGFYAESLEINRKALGNKNPEVAVTLSNLASLKTDEGNYDEALALYREALAIRKGAFGYEHPTVSYSLHSIATVLREQRKYDEALKLFKESLALKQKLWGESTGSMDNTLRAMGGVLQKQNKHEEARKLYDDELEKRRKANDLEGVGNVMLMISFLLDNQDKLDESLDMLKETLVVRKQLHEKAHESVAFVVSLMAGILKDQGKLDESLARYEEALKIDIEALGEEHTTVAIDMNNLGSVYQEMSLYAKALPWYEKCLAMRRKLLGPDSLLVAASLTNLGMLYRDLGDLEKAVGLYEEALKIDREACGNFDPYVASDLHSLASLYHDMDELDAARPLYEEALAIRRRVLNKNHPDISLSLNDLSSLLHDQRRFSEAISLLEEALEIKIAAYGEKHKRVAEGMNNLAAVLRSQDYTSTEADELGRDAYKMALELLGPEHPMTVRYKAAWVLDEDA